MKMKKKDLENKMKINEEIVAEKVQFIDEKGVSCGVIPLKEALALSDEKELDLVMVAERDVPVVKLMNYEKFMYENLKKEKLAQKNNKSSELKTINVRYCIDKHDLETKLKTAKGFLKDGDKVSFLMKFRKKEAAVAKNVEKGKELFKSIESLLSELGGIEKINEFNGRNMSMIISPNVKK